MTVQQILSYARPDGKGYYLLFMPVAKYDALEEMDKEELRRGDPFERRLNHSEMGPVLAFWIHPDIAERLIEKYSKTTPK